MPLSAFKVFSDFAQGTMTEVLAQQVELFNAATRGAITLRANRNAGDFFDRTHWAKISGLVRRRNAYGSGAVSEVDLSQLQETSVKVAAGTPPVRMDPGQFEWILKNPEEGGVVFGQQLAVDRMADMLDVAIAASKAALSAIATNRFIDVGNNASLVGLNTAASRLGDMSQRLACWVGHSKPMFDLWGAAIANGANLFTFGTVNIASDPMGRPIIITDASSLVDPDGAGTGPDVASYGILGLVPGAIMVEDNGDYTANIEVKNGAENIIRTMQAEWSFNVAVKGFAWDKTNGGKSPTTAALATASNWDRYATYHKDLAGVVYEVK